MATSPHGKPEISNRAAEPAHWIGTEWLEPGIGRQRLGEAFEVRSGSTSGTHRAGIWRTGPITPAESPVTIEYSAQDGDATIVVLDGEAVATTVATGERHVLRPGSTLSQPRGLALSWEFAAPGFSCFWAQWSGTRTGIDDEAGLAIGHVDDEDVGWEPYAWEADGKQWRCGENAVLRTSTASGSFRCGVWRSGPDLGQGGSTPVEPLPEGSPCIGDRCGGHRISSSRGVGDESMLLLQGSAHIVNHDTGEEFTVTAGDTIAQWEGPRITWTSTSAHVKKFWIMTNAQPAA